MAAFLGISLKKKKKHLIVCRCFIWLEQRHPYGQQHMLIEAKSCLSSRLAALWGFQVDLGDPWTTDPRTTEVILEHTFTVVAVARLSERGAESYHKLCWALGQVLLLRGTLWELT